MWVLLVRGSAGAFVASHGLGKGKGGLFGFGFWVFFFSSSFMRKQGNKKNSAVLCRLIFSLGACVVYWYVCVCVWCGVRQVPEEFSHGILAVFCLDW